MLTEAQVQQFGADGYLPLGQVASDEQLAELQQRLDDLTLGSLHSERIQYPDRAGAAGEAGGVQGVWLRRAIAALPQAHAARSGPALSGVFLPSDVPVPAWAAARVGRDYLAGVCPAQTGL